jgi:hypothetical protein
MQGLSRLVKSPRTCRFPSRPKFPPAAPGMSGSRDESAQSNHATIYPCYLKRCLAVNSQGRKESGCEKNQHPPPIRRYPPAPLALENAPPPSHDSRPPALGESRPINGPRRSAFETFAPATGPPSRVVGTSRRARMRVALIPSCRAALHRKGEGHNGHADNEESSGPLSLRGIFTLVYWHVAAYSTMLVWISCCHRPLARLVSRPLGRQCDSLTWAHRLSGHPGSLAFKSPWYPPGLGPCVTSGRHGSIIQGRLACLVPAPAGVGRSRLPRRRPHDDHRRLGRSIPLPRYP